MSPVLGALVGVERAPIPPWLPLPQRVLLRVSLALPHAVAWVRHRRPFARLTRPQQEALLADLVGSSSALIRGVAAFWKLAACLGTRT